MYTKTNNYFKICKETRIIECLTCGKKLSGTNAHNMKRHYKLMHRIDIPMGRKSKKSNQQEPINETEENVNEILDVQREFENAEPMEHIPMERVETIYERKLLELKNCKKYQKHKELNKTECLVCGKQLSGVSNSNIKRHFHLVHNVKLETKRKRKHVPEKVDLSISNEDDNSYESSQSVSTKRQKLTDSVTIIDASANIDRNKFLKCCVGLVAVKGISAGIFDDNEFFKTLIAPQEEKFCTNLNSDDISTLLQRANLTIRDKIISKVKKKIVTLKLDLATGVYTNVLSISIQYIDHFKICCNTLDIIQLVKRSTDIRDEVLNCLENYEIDNNQVYCYMTDVITTVGKIKDHNGDDDGVHTKELTVNESGDKTNAGKIFTTEFREVKSANSIIQLTVDDVLTEIESNINQLRGLVKDVQSMLLGYQHVLILDDATNWLSTYEMLKSLLESRVNLEEETAIKLESIENRLDWNFITDLVNALAPLFNLNKQLNQEQYIFGDFYRDWLSCEIELEDLLPTSLYARLFVQSMQKYKKEILKDEACLAALYLDPRFNFCNSVMLNEEQKRRAETHLTKLFKIIHTTYKNQTQSVANESENATMIIPTIKYEDEPSTSKKAYDKLTQRIMNLSANLSEIDEPQRNFKQKLIVLLSTKLMVPLDTNVLEYWKNTNFDADITAILEAALSVPVTQVAIGRTAHDLCYANEGTIDRDLLLTKYNFQEINDNSVEL